MQFQPAQNKAKMLTPIFKLEPATALPYPSDVALGRTEDSPYATVKRSTNRNDSPLARGKFLGVVMGHA
jgi:hypothetical protein